MLELFGKLFIYLFARIETFEDEESLEGAN